MLWISLRELFPTSESYFCCDYNTHYITATTICFFLGLLFGVVLDIFVRWASKMESSNETVRRYLCCKWDSGYESIGESAHHEMEERKRLYENYGDEVNNSYLSLSLSTTINIRYRRQVQWR